MANTGNEGQFTICIDEGSDLVSLDNKDGEGSAMFDEKGEPTQVIENVKRYLSESQQMDQITPEFAKTMAELNMFTPLQLRVRNGDREKNIAGCWVAMKSA